jgi:hypothetical protein
MKDVHLHSVQMLTAEQQSLLDRARYTWHRRREAKLAGMPFGEETVTETILLDLKLSYPGKIWIVPFNKRQEGKIGADWEWCFASEDERHFLPMLVQAKVLDDKEETYNHIARTIGNTGIRQIDRLLETGSLRGVPTTYAFYNHVTDEGRLPQSCGSLLPGYSQSEPWGISIACAERIRDLLPDQRFESIKQVSKPLHCLLCTRGDGNLPKRGSPEAIYRNMSRELKSLRDDIWRPRQERPAYYNLIMELMSDFDESERIFDHRADMREKLAAENPRLDGIVILRDGRRKSRRD